MYDELKMSTRLRCFPWLYDCLWIPQRHTREAEPNDDSSSSKDLLISCEIFSVKEQGKIAEILLDDQTLGSKLNEVSALKLTSVSGLKS